MKRDIILLV